MHHVAAARGVLNGPEFLVRGARHTPDDVVEALGAALQAKGELLSFGRKAKGICRRGHEERRHLQRRSVQVALGNSRAVPTWRAAVYARQSSLPKRLRD